MADDTRDPEVVSEELARTLRELRGELEPPRGPLGLPRPPTPRELLRFTDEYAIPALVAGLEATIRTLELLQGAIRLVEGRPTDAGGRERRLAAAGRGALDRVDAVLAELSAAVEGEPTDPEARRLLEDARGLRDELEAALRPADPESSGSSTAREVPVDVESELQSIREQLDRPADAGRREPDRPGHDGPSDRSGDADPSGEG